MTDHNGQSCRAVYASPIMAAASVVMVSMAVPLVAALEWLRRRSRRLHGSIGGPRKAHRCACPRLARQKARSG